jgi:hypothetical protein
VKDEGGDLFANVQLSLRGWVKYTESINPAQAGRFVLWLMNFDDSLAVASQPGATCAGG